MRALAEQARAALHLVRSVIAQAPHAAWREVLAQTHVVANGSALFVGVSMGCVGAILVVQAATQAKLIVGDVSLVGPAFLQLLVHEFGPLLVALLLAARYGAGVAAELGAMAISEQLDALRMAGTDPVRYLVVPRVLGGVCAALPITVWGCACAFFAGGVAAVTDFHVQVPTYANLALVHLEDVAVGSTKALLFGALVPLIACFAGLRARLGAPGVGRATTRAVIVGSVALLACDLTVDLTLSALWRLGEWAQGAL